MNKTEQIKQISGANPLKCMKCGKCSATCPSYDEMDIKPHQLVSYVQRMWSLPRSSTPPGRSLSAREAATT